MNDLKFLKKQDPSTTNDFPESILQIRTDSIRPNHAQPRARFDHNSILRLADSIRRYGILQPLTVRRSPDDTIYDYELIAGERRLRAAKMLGYYTVPCILIEADERMTAEMAIIENLLREDLNMFEQAYGFQKLIENHHLTQEDVARRLSLSQSAVANKLRLLKLSLEEQNLILECALTERHARALLKISDPAVRSELIRKIAAKNGTSGKVSVILTPYVPEKLQNCRKHCGGTATAPLRKPWLPPHAQKIQKMPQTPRQLLWIICQRKAKKALNQSYAIPITFPAMRKHRLPCPPVFPKFCSLSVGVWKRSRKVVGRPL